MPPIAHALTLGSINFWVCEQYASAREGVPQDVLSLIASAPEYLTCYGWSVRPFTLHAWLQELARVEISVPCPLAGSRGRCACVYGWQLPQSRFSFM